MGKLVSLVIPVFCEEANLAPLWSAVSATVQNDIDWEFVFVDDGSSDGTYGILSDLAKTDSRVRAIRLSRNFGSHVAISAGLDEARGDAAIIVSADLQEPLESIGEMIDRWREGNDVVWGVRRSRQDPTSSRVTSRVLNRLFGAGNQLPGYPRNATSFMLLDRKVIDAVRSFPERNRLVGRLVAWAGFRSAQVQCDFKPRRYGKSHWTLGKKVKAAIDMFASFSYLPIRMVSVAGMLISLVSFAYGVAIVILALVRGSGVQGWPTLMAAVLFLGGLQLLVSGVLGEYIWRALDESRRRPLYFISEKAGHPLTHPSDARGQIAVVAVESELPRPTE